MEREDKNLHNAVKNAREAFYSHKCKQKKVFRKEARRNKRLQKKAKQFQSQFKNKMKDQTNDKDQQKLQVKMKKKKKRKCKSSPSKESNKNDEEFSYEKFAYEAANKRDDQLISSLGKKLGFKKSTKKLPNVFEQDGLDFLLDVCEPLGGDDFDGDSDEEYLRNKKMARNKPKTEQAKEELSERARKNKLLFGEEFDDDNEEKEEDEVEDEEMSAGDDVEDMNDVRDYDDDDCLSDGDDVDFDGDFEDIEMMGDDCDSMEDDDVDIQYGNRTQDIESENEDVENARSNKKSKRIKPSHKQSVSEPCTTGKYIPPSLRKLQENKNVDFEKQKQERLSKQLKGLLNRVSAATLPGIIGEIEGIYEKNSRNTMNEILFNLISESCIGDAVTPHRLAIHHMVIVAALHKTTNSEVGSYFLQMLVEKFDELHKDDVTAYGEGKRCLNTLFLIVTLYNFKIVDCMLMYDIIRRLLKHFTEQDIEMILTVLRTCGTDIRKDDPGSLKDIILEVQAKSVSSEIRDQSRVRYMLETINALKNNNIRKIAQYDPTVMEEGNKIISVVVKGRESMSSGTRLKVSLDDLLNAREKGKWWVVGSAWTGRGPIEGRDSSSVNNAKDGGGADLESKDASSKLMEVAKKQRMNTNLRKNIFCVIMSSEDYLDAFEKLQRMNLTEKQSREIIHVLLDCCLQEKTYNPFYVHLADQFCGAAHSNKVTLQYAFWDRFKAISTLPKHATNNMAHALAHVITSKSLSLSVLKVVSFGVLDKPSIRFFIKFFQILITEYPENTFKSTFQRIASISKLSLLREGIKVFLRHFLLPQSKPSDSESMKDRKMKELIEIAESALDGQEYIPL